MLKKGADIETIKSTTPLKVAIKAIEQAEEQAKKQESSSGAKLRFF